MASMNETVYRSPSEAFQRRMDDDAAWADEHHIKVRFDGQYRAVCSCAWIGPVRASRTKAGVDGADHRS